MKDTDVDLVLDGGSSGFFQFGLELGSGVRTFVPTALPYMVATALALVGSVIDGLVAGLMFGTGRAWFLIGSHRTEGVTELSIEGQVRAIVKWLPAYSVGCVCLVLFAAARAATIS